MTYGLLKSTQGSSSYQHLALLHIQSRIITSYYGLHAPYILTSLNNSNSTLVHTGLLSYLKVHFLPIWIFYFFYFSTYSELYFHADLGSEWSYHDFLDLEKYISYFSFLFFIPFDFSHSHILLCHYTPMPMVSKTAYHNKEQYLPSHMVSSDPCELSLLVAVISLFYLFCFLTNLFWGCLWKLKNVHTCVRVSS